MRWNHEEAAARVLSGKALRCPHCDHDRFRHRKALLPSRPRALFDLEWMSPKADLYVCGRCGHVAWFRPPRPD
jgi:hypothetical protein